MSKKNSRLARRNTFDAELEHPSPRLMPVEEPDPVALAEEGSHHHEKNEKLNLTCRHAIHLLSLEPEVL